MVFPPFPPSFFARLVGGALPFSVQLPRYIRHRSPSMSEHPADPLVVCFKGGILFLLPHFFFERFFLPIVSATPPLFALVFLLAVPYGCPLSGSGPTCLTSARFSQAPSAPPFSGMPATFSPFAIVFKKGLRRMGSFWLDRWWNWLMSAFFLTDVAVPFRCLEAWSLWLMKWISDFLPYSRLFLVPNGPLRVGGPRARPAMRTPPKGKGRHVDGSFGSLFPRFLSFLFAWHLVLASKR